MARIPLSDPVIQNLIAEKQIERRQREIANSLNPIQGSGLGAVNVSDLGIFNNPGISQNVFDKAVERGKEKEKTGLGQLIEGFQRFISPDMTPQQTLLALAGPKTEGALLENLFSTGLGTFTTASDSEETRPQILKGIGPDIAIDEFNFPDEITEQLNNMRSSETNQTNQKNLTVEGIQPDEAIDNVGRGDAPEITSEDKKKLQESLNTDKKSDPLEEAFSEAMQAYNEALTGEVSKDSIEKYKKQFAEATGIDVSGKVDNRTALGAFGLALMQNKAGKDFNVSKILSEVGKAGEAAQPALEQARKEARAGEISAGKFGLEQAIADRQSAISAAKDKLTNAYDRIIKRQEDLQEIKLKNLDYAQQRILESEKHENNMLVKELEMRIEDSNKQKENKFKTSDKTKIPTGIQGLDIFMTTSENDGRSLIVNPDAQVGAFGAALSDVLEGENSIDEISSLIQQASKTPGGINIQKLNEIAQGVAASFGYNVNEVPVFNEEGEITGYEIKDKPLTTAKAIRDRIISQYKRFLTQETGNGISNVDIANIERLLGSIDFLKDPADALKRLEEAKKIFTSKKDKLSNVLEKFGDERYYLNTDTFNNTQNLLNDAINQAYNFDFGQGPVKDPETGLNIYSVL